MKEFLTLSFFFVVVAAIVGWFMNLWAIVVHTPEMGTEFVLRLVGLFVAPLGSAMGLFF